MTSEPEKLLPVIQADREAAASLLTTSEWARPRILNGSLDARHEVQAFARHRLSSPVSGTDMVPADLRALSGHATPGPWAWEQCGDKEDAPVVGIAFPGDDPDCKAPYEGQFRDSDAARFTIAYDWQSCDGCSPSSNAAFAVAAVNYVRAVLSASPSTPVPVIAEAGERDEAEHVRREELQQIADGAYGDGPFTRGAARDQLAALSTPATLDNTAAPIVRPFSEWHEDHGDVLWWKLPIHESPYVGSPLDLGRSMKVEIYIGFEQHEFPISNTGGWPFDENDEASLFWSPLPDARAVTAEIATLTAKTEKAE